MMDVLSRERGMVTLAEAYQQARDDAARLFAALETEYHAIRPAWPLVDTLALAALIFTPARLARPSDAS